MSPGSTTIEPHRRENIDLATLGSAYGALRTNALCYMMLQFSPPPGMPGREGILGMPSGPS